MKLIILALSAVLCFGSPAPSSVPNCGNPAIKPDISTNIVGGKDAIPYSWPWHVSLHRDSKSISYCGGALISNQWVLTSASCLFNGISEIRLGLYNQAKRDEDGEQVLSVSETHLHPKYRKGVFDYNFALLKLSSPVQFTDHISPICLPNQDEELPAAGTDLFVTGWGLTDGSVKDSYSQTLKQVNVPVVSNAVCKSAMSGSSPSFKESNMFCAGPKKVGKGFCQNDSGSPAVVKGNDGKWKQVGIVNWRVLDNSPACTPPGQYQVYSKISSAMDFIKQYVDDV